MEKMRVVLTTVFLFIGATVADVGIDDKSINPAEAFDIDLFSEAEAYENPKFQRSVTRCTWHVAETCSRGSEALNNKRGLALCLFDSIEKCLVEQTPQVFQLIKPPNTAATSQVSPPESPNPFRTVLRTCARVTAQTCLTAPNFATSLLAPCLISSLNQCVYSTAGAPLTIGPSIVP